MTTETTETIPHHRYVYSIDGSEYRGDINGGAWETREEALAAGRARAAQIAALKETTPGPVWTGIQIGCTASAYYPDANAIIEHMASAANGEIGSDAAEEWPDTAPEAVAELEAFMNETVSPWLDAWVEKHGMQPRFWSITETVKHADDDGALAKTHG